MLFLVGCSASNSGENFTTKPIVNKGFVEVSGIDDKQYDIIGSAINDDTITILATNINNVDTGFYFYIIDAKNCKLIDKKQINDNFNMESISNIIYDENGNVNIIDDFNKKKAIFDSNYKFVEIADYTPIETTEQYKDNIFYNDAFATYDYYARYYSFGNMGMSNDFLIFPSENDKLYFTTEYSNDYLCCSNKKALTAIYEEKYDNLKVLDFINNKVICEARINHDTTDNCSTSPLTSGINDKFAYTVICTFFDDEEYEKDYNKVYIWDYNYGAKSRDLDVKQYDSNSLSDEIDNEKSKLKNAYKINIIIDEEPDCTPGITDNDVSVEFGADKLKTFIILREMNKFFSLFPTGIFNDIYEEYDNSDQLDVYIVKRIIDEETAAFANIWEETPLMCFSTDEYTFSQLPHEFMHILDIKLFNTYERNNDDFWFEWEKHNYEGFYYGSADNVWDGKNLEYFVSNYSMTSQQEDRAEIFMQLFTNIDDAGQFNDEPHILNKAKALCQYLRDNYPSLKNENELYWEKTIKE